MFLSVDFLKRNTPLNLCIIPILSYYIINNEKMDSRCKNYNFSGERNAPTPFC